MTSHQQEQLIEALMYRVSQEQRAHVMREVPDAYNAYCRMRRPGVAPIVEVVRVSDGSAIRGEV